ncbi:MAG: hypothetical protein CVU06_11000 [Bacteroidetes bacterium HGW-Bacteroidetes-22]|nr:MAG: hypothetical protein CVU06_11000 [Bacteroidetes bacterium HGW-Bacteroidetes-22]
MALKTEKNKLKALRKQMVTTLTLLHHRGWALIPQVHLTARVTGLPELTDLITDLPLLTIQLPEPFPKLAGDYLLITRPGLPVADVIKKPEETILLFKCAENGTVLHLMGSQHDIRIEPCSALINHLRFHEKLAGTIKNAIVMLAEPDDLIRLSAIMPYENAFSPDKVLCSAWPPVKNLLDPPDVKQLCQIFDTDTNGYRVAGHLPGLVIWEKHGAYVAAKRISSAITMLEAASKAARLALPFSLQTETIL